MRLFIASEPLVPSDSAYAPTISAVASLGRYFFFCASVPKKTRGSVPMPLCAPSVTMKLPYFAMKSAMMADDTLSMSEPPYSAGMSALVRPISAAFFSSSRATDQSLCSIFSATGRISLIANSSDSFTTIC